ncbi:MAG: glycosyltransferase [Phormidesmis sp.]
MGLESIRLLIVVENTDYREHLVGISIPETLPETLANRVSPTDFHILSSAARWSEQVQEVAIFSGYSAESYSEISRLGIRLMGSGLGSTSGELASGRDKVRLVADFCPTHIVMCTPIYAVLRWATRNQIPSVVLLSNWQEPLGWFQRWQHGRLVKQLNHDSVSWVGNHGIDACKILESSGVQAQKIIPWQWPQPQRLSQYILPKQIRCEQSTIDLIYAGPITHQAGISDLLVAASQIRQRSTAALSLQIVSDQVAPEPTSQDSIEKTLKSFQKQAQQLGIAEDVSFSSALSDERLIEQMRDADLVIIPSLNHDVSTHDLPTDDRPTCALPLEPPSSLYMAMAARTPIIASDHPHFREHLSHGVNAMIFPAGNARSLAHRIERIMGQPQLYTQLSEASETALNTIKVPARWSELIERWLEASGENAQWLCNCAFSSGRYQSLLSSQKPATSLVRSA